MSKNTPKQRVDQFKEWLLDIYNGIKDSAIDIELNKVFERVKNIEFDVEVDDTLKKHLISVGTDTRFGARILKRTVQKWVDDAITEKILSDNPEKGSKFLLSYNETEKKTDVKIKKPTKRKNKS
jgi:ATP-dependent Clp protease ATP-binding subunit ClpC